MAAVWIELEGRRDRIVHLAAELEEEEFGSPVATFGECTEWVVDSAMVRLELGPARFVREWLIGCGEKITGARATAARACDKPASTNKHG